MIITQESICKKKSTYRDKATAKAFLRRKGYRNQKPYRCPVCSHWHLTTKRARSLDFLTERAECL
jgi:hypothetical protein